MRACACDPYTQRHSLALLADRLRAYVFCLFDRRPDTPFPSATQHPDGAPLRSSRCVRLLSSRSSPRHTPPLRDRAAVCSSVHASVDAKRRGIHARMHRQLPVGQSPRAVVATTHAPSTDVLSTHQLPRDRPYGGGWVRVHADTKGRQSRCRIGAAAHQGGGWLR